MPLENSGNFICMGDGGGLSVRWPDIIRGVVYLGAYYSSKVGKTQLSLGS